MSKNFYRKLRENLNKEDFNRQKTALLIDDYIKAFNCKANYCDNLMGIKKGFGYVVKKYKTILKLQMQNENIFSQILHDIKNPMLGIKFALEGVKRNEIEEEIYNINLSILRLIQDFLFLYSFKEGFRNIKFEQFNPCDIVENEYKIYSSIVKQKGIKIKFTCKGNLTICSHKAIFQRISSNLISNAIKYAPNNTLVSVELCEHIKKVAFRITNLIDKNGVSDENSFGMGLLISKRLAKRIKSVLYTKRTDDKILFELNMPKTVHLGHVQ